MVILCSNPKIMLNMFGVKHKNWKARRIKWETEEELCVRMNGMYINVLICDLKQISINYRSKPTLSRGDKCHNNFLFCLLPFSSSSHLLFIHIFIYSCSSLRFFFFRFTCKTQNATRLEIKIRGTKRRRCIDL